MKLKTKTAGTREWTKTDEGAGENFNYGDGCFNNCKGYCYACSIALRYNRIKNRKEWKHMTNRAKPSFPTSKKVKGLIMTPTTHDIFSSNLHLAKKYYTELLESGNQLLIVTKPIPKVIQDLALHLNIFKDNIIWRISITNLDQELRKKWEEGASAYWHRINTLKWLYDHGFQTSVSIEPFLHDPVPIVFSVIDYVTEKIWIGLMNKVHVDKKMWTPELDVLYSPYNLKRIKDALDKLHDDRIMYKDAFLNNLPDLVSNNLLAYMNQEK